MAFRSGNGHLVVAGEVGGRMRLILGVLGQRVSQVTAWVF
jgi:hypothetical protein